MVKVIEETRLPPITCERCGHPLPDGPDPLRRPIDPGELRRFTGDHQPARPVKVSRPSEDGELEVRYWCSSRHYKMDTAKSEPKRKRGRPGRDSQFHITCNPLRAA